MSIKSDIRDLKAAIAKLTDPAAGLASNADLGALAERVAKIEGDIGPDSDLLSDQQEQA